MNQQEVLRQIYMRDNFAEDQPDIVTIVDDINYLLSLVGFDSNIRDSSTPQGT